MKAIIFLILAFFAFYSIFFILSFFKKENIKRGVTLIITTFFLFVLIVFLLAYSLKSNLLQTPFPLFFITFISISLPIGFLLFVEDIWRFLIYRRNFNFFHRSKKVRMLAFIIAFILLSTIFYGIIVGKTDFKLKHQQLSFSSLPEKFDGFKILHISDLHLGSFTEQEANKLKLNIYKALEQKPDVIVFTGDLVNLKAEEALAYKDFFKTLKVPYLKYAILGNHDYGNYIYENGSLEQKAELDSLKKIYSQLGFMLLDNISTKIIKDSSYINLLGIGHYNKKPSAAFDNYADIKKASKDTSKEDFNILLSHNPQFFDNKYSLIDSLGIDLTLSGHTHGLQFGINCTFIKISPAQLLYDSWLGLYNRENRYLYVNSGLGYHIFPARVGILPELTLLELRKFN